MVEMQRSICTSALMASRLLAPVEQLGIYGGARGSPGSSHFPGGRSGVPSSFNPAGLGSLPVRPPLGETLVSRRHRRQRLRWNE